MQNATYLSDAIPIGNIVMKPTKYTELAVAIIQARSHTRSNYNSKPHHCSESNQPSTDVDSDDGLVPNRRRTIIWTNDGNLSFKASKTTGFFIIG